MGIWTPEAQWVGPSPNQSGAMVEQRGLVLHIMQGSLAGSISWGKNPASGVSFHFGTRKSDGLVQQLVDTSITAWTQCNGNGRWISVENEDFSGNPLSPAQVESIAKLYARGVREYGWPYALANAPDGRGLGYHAMGGVPWCNHPSCPGQPIIDQRPAILARAAQILGGAPPAQQEDDMRLLIAASGSVYRQDGTDPVSRKPILWPISQEAQANEYYRCGYPATPIGGEPNWNYWVDGNTLAPPTVAVELTDEQLAEIGAAAEAGAEAGSPSHDELVAAAQEGANLAEDA
jgi:hypothetical protein